MRENPCIIISWLAARRADGVWCISKAWNFILFLVIVKFHEIFMSLRWRFSFLSQVCKYEIKLLEGRRNWGLAKELHYIMTKSKSRRNNWGVLRLLNWNGVYAYLSRLSKTGIKSICRTESLDMQLRSKVQDWMQQTLFLERGYMWLQHPRFTVRGWVLLLLCVYVCVCVCFSRQVLGDYYQYLRLVKLMSKRFTTWFFHHAVSKSIKRFSLPRRHTLESNWSRCLSFWIRSAANLSCATAKACY